MTLNELILLKYKIQEQKDSLMQKDLNIDIIYAAITVLEDLDANRALVNIWYRCNKEFLEAIIKELE